MSKQSQVVWSGRHGQAMLDVSKDIDPTTYAGELFSVVSYEVPKSWSYHKITVRHDDGLEFPIKLYAPQRAIMQAAGHTLPWVAGVHEFSATITYQMVNDFGENTPQLTTCEPVPRAIVPYALYAPYTMIEQESSVLTALRQIVAAFEQPIETVKHTDPTQRANANAVYFAKTGLRAGSADKAQQWLTIACGYLSSETESNESESAA